MKVLVTGASGNVGKYVVEELLKLGEQVVVAGTDEGKLFKMFGETVDIVKFDFTIAETYETALKEVNRVFLMRPPHLGKPEDLYPFIDAMKRHNIELVSFLSLMGIEKNTMPPHYKIEKYIENSGIPYAHIRPGFFMQNISGIHAEEIKTENQIFVPAGKSKTSFIDAQDIGVAVAVVLHDATNHQNTAYTLTGAETLDYEQVAQILSKVLERPITYAQPGFLKYRKAYIEKRGMDQAYVNVTMALYLMTRLGTAKAVTDEFYQLTGRTPKNFETFAIENKAAWEE